MRIPLTAIDTAYVALVMERHAATVLAADQLKEQALGVLLKERGVPAGLSATIVDGHLCYEAPTE